MGIDIQAVDTISVNLGPRSYQIAIVSHQLQQAASLLESWWRDRNGMSSAFLSQATTSRSSVATAKLPKPFALIVTDEHLAGTHAHALAGALMGAGWHVETEILPPGETSKSIDSVSAIHDRLICLAADRRTVIVAVGGGVIGDLAGFAAATFVRGIPFIQVPTTLLSAVDSSVGGKTGVNHPRAKNMIGAFYQPIGVLIDTATLESLSDREYRAGLAEVVKYGVILDAEFFAYLEEHVPQIAARQPEVLRKIISESCRLKAHVVEQDEFELSGLRASLNYGHTFGHAFEALAGYGQLLHGEAVSIGMVYASRLAERRGLIDASVTQRQIALLEQLQLPTSLPPEHRFARADIVARMRLDKKAIAGQMRFILPTQVGQVQVYSDVPEADVLAVLEAAGH